jgi:O-antigen/teichoic acid export membrane protein
MLSLTQGIMKREKYRHTLTVAYLAVGLSQSFELAYNYLFFLVLSIEQIGLYGWASALFMFFNVAVDMGIEPVLIRKFGQGELRLSRAFQAILLLRVPIIVLGFVLIIILYEYGLLNSNQYFVIILMGVQVIFNVWDGVFRSWLLANNRQDFVNIINMAFSSLKLAFIGVMFFFSWNSLYFLLIGILILRMIGSGIICFFTYTISLANEAATAVDVTTGQTAGELFRAGLSLGGVNIFGIIQNRLDWLLVSGMISTPALASYSLANKLYEILQLIIGVSTRTMYPWLCRDQEDERNSLLFLVRLVIMVGVLLGLCGIFISPALIQLMFPNKFIAAEQPVKILMLSASMIAASAVFYHLALSKGLESKLLLIISIVTTLQFASNLYLIPQFGITGAALGMLVLAITTLTGFTILVQAEKLVPPWIIRGILMFLLASVFYVSVLLYSNVTEWLAVLVVLVMITGTGWIFLFESADRRYMLSQISRVSQNFMVAIRAISIRSFFR